MKPENVYTAYCLLVVWLLALAFVVHKAHSQEIDAETIEEYVWWHRLGILEAAHDEKDDYPILLPAEHDQRFWLPEKTWKEQYCKRHDAKACKQ